MSVVDLDVERARRAEIKAAVHRYVTGVARDLIEASIRQAERAFAVSGPLAATDVELSRGINRFVLRRLRARVRRNIPHDLTDLRASAVNQAERVFTGRLLALTDERDSKAARP